MVPDADSLGEERMQAVAAELNLAETVFVLGGAERLRIFTPRAELPLAGHPVVGASLELARLGRISPDGTHVFQTGAGEVPVTVRDGVATMTQAAFDPGRELGRDEVAATLGLAGDALARVPRLCSTTGVRQLFAEVRSREALAAVRPDLEAIAGLYDFADGVVAWCEHGDELAQRFFAPAIGISEDPATGSAAGALAALRVYEGGAPGSVLVRQGEEVGRPSEIHVSVGGSAGAPSDVRVGGRAVLVLEGTLAEGVVG